MKGFTYFEFDLATPLFEQIRACLDAVAVAPLTLKELQNGGDGPGVYMLFHCGTPVYIGKASDSVVRRLVKHMRIISGRKNIAVSDMSFKTATFARTWNPFLPESHLIEHYKTKDEWNSKGFGGNEPGKRRYATAYKPDHFFTKYPINESFVCEWLVKGDYETSQLCKDLRRLLPFWVKLHEYEDIVKGATTHIAKDKPKTIDVIHSIGKSLGKGWRIAIIPSHILIQFNTTASYPNMQIVYPS